MGTYATSAFGVIHKAVTDSDDPKLAAAVRSAPGKVNVAGIRAKLAPLKADAVKAVVKR
jgi:hypothetical protein